MIGVEIAQELRSIADRFEKADVRLHDNKVLARYLERAMNEIRLMIEGIEHDMQNRKEHGDGRT